MTSVLLTLLTVVLLAASILVVVAADLARQALRLLVLERRRDHWRRLGEASQEVQRAADRYERVMAGSLQPNDGHGDEAGRRKQVDIVAREYREACGRLARVLVAGPQPPGSRAELLCLIDERRPEAVAALRAGDTVRAEVELLQDALDGDDLAERVNEQGPLGLWGIVASWVREHIRRPRATRHGGL